MYYTFNQLNDYINQFDIKKYKLISKKKVKYYNIPCAFDIESTSAYIDTKKQIYQADFIAKEKERLGKDFDDKEYEKVAWMYVWMLSVDDKIIIGRTWDEYLLTIDALRKKFDLSENKMLIIYVHNLAFEFQFIKDLFSWSKIFASEFHKVIYANTTNGLQFKCSLFLSNSSLETVGKNLVKYKAEKQVGKLDYNKIRHSDTPLSNDEIEYCLYDVIVLSNYIKECIEKEKSGKITDIPLTSTGYVRRYCKEYCLKDNLEKELYYKITRQMNMDEDTYNHLKRAFQGGFTHTNSINMGEVFYNVKSMDFTSSYPAVLLFRKYPMGKGYYYKPKNVKDFEFQIKHFACLFTITFHNLRLKENITECIISKSDKLYECVKAIINNGRIDNAEKVTLCITEADYENIKRFYEWDRIGIGFFKRYRKDYLPKRLLECILKFYSDKTKLKDVIGEEVNYQNSKSMLNAVFGMMVTDPVRDTIIYDNEIWFTENGELSADLEHYNKSKNRFLAYEWGVWCTAYARQNLFSGILELGYDFIYADTDSLKFVNYEKHKAYFERYNNYVLRMIDKVAKHYDFDINLFKPKTIKGKEKIIGLWDEDGNYVRFKALGAKRYMVQYNKDDEHYKPELNGISLTVSGINKKIALPNLIEKAKNENKDIFDVFDDDMYVNCESSGKLLHSYISHPINIKVKDYLNNVYNVKEKSSVHLEPTSYSLSISDVYLNYVRNIKTKYSKAI